MIKFPKDFLWGAATSAPQTEGAALADGKSPSTWDKWFEMEPELFFDQVGPNDTSNVYYQYKEDVALMKKMDMNSYRTSIAWTRLLPDGKTLIQKRLNFTVTISKKCLIMALNQLSTYSTLTCPGG